VRIKPVRAVPCLGKAGSITIHHVRAVHGSATNLSGQSRRFLLYQVSRGRCLAAARAQGRHREVHEQLIVGEPSLAPRPGAAASADAATSRPSTRARSTRTSVLAAAAISRPPDEAPRIAAE